MLLLAQALHWVGASQQVACVEAATVLNGDALWHACLGALHVAVLPVLPMV